MVKPWNLNWNLNRMKNSTCPLDVSRAGGYNWGLEDYPSLVRGAVAIRKPGSHPQGFESSIFRLVRCLRGRKDWFAKPAQGNPLPWVRIPPSPLESSIAQHHLSCPGRASQLVVAALSVWKVARVRFIGTVLKTVARFVRAVGSNPTPSFERNLER